MTDLTFPHKMSLLFSTWETAMTLPLIDFSKFSLQETHQQALKCFSLFSPEALNHLCEANRYYEQIPSLFLGLSGKDSALHHENLVAAAKAYDSTAFKEHTTLYLNDVQKKQMHNWYVNQQATLNNDWQWKRLQGACVTREQKEKLLSLKTAWMKHANYSFYTSQALIAVIDHYLPVFEQYLSLLKSEYQINKNKLYWADRRHIKNYVAILTKQIQKLRQGIAQAMLARLKVASDTKDIHYDDVTYHLAHQLKNMKLLKENFTLPPQPRHDLSGSIFLQYHQFIQQFGTKQQIADLNKLSWYQTDEQHVLLQKNNHAVVIPKIFERDIKQPSILEKLFGYHSRDFLQDQFPFITTLRFLPQPKNDFKSLFSFYPNAKWQALCQLVKQVEQQNNTAESQKPKGFWSRLFGHHKQKFLSNWQVYLGEQQKQIVEVMLDYATFINEQLKTRLTLELDSEELCTSDFQSHLKKFVEELQAAVSHVNLSVDNTLRYQTFIQTVERVLTLPADRERQKAQQNKEQKEKGIEAIYDISLDEDTIFFPLGQATYDEDNPFRPVPAQNNLQAWENLLIGLMPVETHFDYHSQDFKDKVMQLETFIELKKLNGWRLDEEVKIQEMINKLFEVYLNTWGRLPEDEKREAIDHLTSFEQAFENIVPKVLRDKFKDLINVRTEYNWFTFQAKCHSLLTSCNSTWLSEEKSLAQLEDYLKSKAEDISLPRSQNFLNNPSTFFFQSDSSRSVWEQEAQHPILAY